MAESSPRNHRSSSSSSPSSSDGEASVRCKREIGAGSSSSTDAKDLESSGDASWKGNIECKNECKKKVKSIECSGTLERRFSWAGKGTTGIPFRRVYGPLTSAAAVTSDLPPPSEGGTGNGISTGTVVGVAAAVVAVIFLVLGVLWWIGRRKRKHAMDQVHRSTTDGPISRPVFPASTGGGSGSGGNLMDNAGIACRSKSELNTLRVRAPTVDKSEPTSSQLKLERSETEGQRNRNLLADKAAQILDDKISEEQKLKLLNRIATVKDDGTVELDVSGDVEEAQVLGMRSDDGYNTTADDEAQDTTDLQYIPPMQIVMLIVGTRGDVQPFVAIGKRLQDYGHRVRLATHSNFKEFVLTAGLEFYPLGGDPKILAGYMVKNKGFLPSGPSEIPVQRNQMKDIIYSLLPACNEADPDTKVPFKAGAIIANPPAYGHVHVAESLQVPIHIFFTMPWTPTSEFPHPLCRVKQPAGYRLSYQIVDSMIWLGIWDMINDVRKKKLKLRPVTCLSGFQGSDSDVPHGYIWSPHLVPKPKDWGHKVDVVGFCFLDLASNYEPPEPLLKWLEAGPKPIYIGFGSLPVQEPEKMTQIIVEALEQTGQRGIINKGWGGLGNLAEPKDFVYLLDNVPHDWLFLQCKAVVHHGGAGTTAAGLRAACPTTVVPFFGDQPFWGERAHARGVGPPPIQVDEFSLPKLVDAIKFMLDPVVKERAVELARAMENEDGVTGAVKAFFKHLPKKKPESESCPEQKSIFCCFCSQ